MSRQLSQGDRAIWRRLVNSHMAFSQALKDFFSEGTPRVPLIKEAFRRGDIATVLYVARHMKEDELKQILDELVRVSTAPGYAGTIREIILSLPREWVLANIYPTKDEAPYMLAGGLTVAVFLCLATFPIIGALAGEAAGLGLGLLALLVLGIPAALALFGLAMWVASKV